MDIFPLKYLFASSNAVYFVKVVFKWLIVSFSRLGTNFDRDLDTKVLGYD